MIFGCVDGAESQGVCNLGTCRWHAGFIYNVLNYLENLFLFGGKLRHVRDSILLYRVTV